MKFLIPVFVALFFSANSYSAATYEEFQAYNNCVGENLQLSDIEIKRVCGERPHEVVVAPCASIDLDIGDLHIFDIFVLDQPMIPYAKLHWDGRAFEIKEIQK